MGYPYRVDMQLYTYQFTSETLIKVTKNVLAVSIVISSIQLSTLGDSTIGAMVQLCYAEADEAIQQKILDKLLAIKAEMKNENLTHTDQSNAEAIAHFKQGSKSI